jgi:hypothetical protein
MIPEVDPSKSGVDTSVNVTPVVFHDANTIPERVTPEPL